MEISLSMRGQIESLRLKYGRVTASHAFATLYIWREDMGLSVCLEDHLYAVKCRWRGENAWFFPCGKREAACRFIREQMKMSGLRLCYMEEADVELLEKEFPGAFRISEAEGDHEYLYDCAEQRALVGKRFAAIRNHIRRAEADHVLECEPLNRENLAEAMKVNRQWESRSSGQSDRSAPTDRPGGTPPESMAPANLREGMLEDGAASETLLREWDALGSFGVLIRVDGEPHAVAAGYPLGMDTYDLCLAKQRFALPGLGAYTKHAFFCALPESVTCVNAEEDLGIEGLRRMKRQMRPSRLLKMYEAVSTLG
ncbi:MAG: phosphatidylglycerol lysyltransferase domain-containing protein [Lachnospiraceae bacterium]|nr:phosphatidylglycerol lysyltransferase domain-containing protein [Lachnospiraceae bacterium]